MPLHRMGCAAIVLGLAAAPAAAATTTVHALTGGADGATPIAAVTVDASGTIYGETTQGADLCGGSLQELRLGCGTVFRLSPGGQLTTLVTFDGPNGAGGNGKPTLIGNTLYGVTSYGGSGSGTIFSVHTDGTNFTLLHQFATSGLDGENPKGPLIPAPGGGFYGICEFEGDVSAPYGTLYRLGADGTFTVLHDFIDSDDGAFPNALLIDASGTLYGSTDEGGVFANHHSYGVIYQFVPSTGVFTVLHALNGQSDGKQPMLGSIDAHGVLYGATDVNGSGRGGTLFTLTPAAGAYTLTTIYNFPVGDVPGSGPTLASNGALIGATNSGTTPGRAGMLYYFSAKTLTTLVTFPPASGGGTANPAAQPVIGPGNTAYGTTAQSGTSPCINTAGNKISGGCGLIYTYTRRAP